jgi:hypothetical protein
MLCSLGSNFAIRNLSNSKRLPANAIYGFIAMLRKLIQEQSLMGRGAPDDA